MPVVMLQPGDTVVDYSWSRPDLQTLIAMGYKGVIRYVSRREWATVPDAGDKLVSYAEYEALLASGLAVALVFQTTALRPLDGYNAGMIDAQNATEFAAFLGYPKDAVIFFAVDFDAMLPQVEPYLKAIRDYTNGRPIGFYGGVKISEALDQFDYRWQTEAWSYGRVDPLAHMIQRIGVWLEGTDHNDVKLPIPFAATATQTTPIANVTGQLKERKVYLVQLLSGQVALSDGFHARILFDDGSEYKALRTMGLPMITVVDEWVDKLYRGMPAS